MDTPIEPYATGMLDVGDGQSVYWECCGNPDGRPAVWLHGGPGSGILPSARRRFDPERHRAILFDQRGCGRSLPSAADPGTDLSVNTTQHLIADIEKLRELHRIESWTVVGGSWGSALALAYAEAHPERVHGVVLALVGVGSAREIRWITEDVGRIFPREWERFAGAVPQRLRDRPLVDAYAVLLADPDPAVRAHAAYEWCRWEDVHVSLVPGHQPSLRYENPEFRYLFARLVTHYWRHACFLQEGALLENLPGLDGIPGILVNGRYDVSGPLEAAWQIHRRWRTSELRVVDDAGHGGGTFAEVLTDAISRVIG